jgi:cytochrome bd ubiquinol oxidase subunit II
MDLHIFWFILLGILMAGYGILDGFDLGVGILHMAVKTDAERRLMMASIGPIWDGNEVWLVVFGGALFAAFPNVYAAAFTGFYLAFMILLFALILRAVSLEFRNKKESALWRSLWDCTFFASSLLSAFIFGVAVGCTLKGVGIGADGTFFATTADIFHPYPVMVGVFSVAACTLHGALYLDLKTEGEFRKRVKGWLWNSFKFFGICYVLTTILTLIMLPKATHNFSTYPISWVVVILNVLAVANIPRAIHLNKPFYAFLSSCCCILAFTFLYGVALFPNLLVSTLNPEWNLTVYNASSSEKTLGIMTIVAALGMPFVLTYTCVVYWVFRGRMKLSEFTY